MTSALPNLMRLGESFIHMWLHEPYNPPIYVLHPQPPKSQIFSPFSWRHLRLTEWELLAAKIRDGQRFLSARYGRFT